MMNKKILPYLLLVFLLGLLIFIKYRQRSPEKPSNTTEVTEDKKRPVPAPVPNHDRGFNRQVTRLRFTRHARCRMECRYIDESEVKEILATGKVNQGKSELDDANHPRYALEGTTHDGQHVRIVLAQEAKETSVITVIDLDKEWICNCK